MHEDGTENVVVYMHHTQNERGIPSEVFSSAFKAIINSKKASPEVLSLCYISLIIDSPIPQMVFNIGNTLWGEKVPWLYYCIYNPAFPCLF